MIETKQKKYIDSYSRYLYTINKVGEGDVIHRQRVRYSSKVGSKFVVVDEDDNFFRDVETPIPLFVSTGNILRIDRTTNASPVIITDAGEVFFISKEETEPIF